MLYDIKSVYVCVLTVRGRYVLSGHVVAVWLRGVLRVFHDRWHVHGTLQSLVFHAGGGVVGRGRMVPGRVDGRSFGLYDIIFGRALVFLLTFTSTVQAEEYETHDDQHAGYDQRYHGAGGEGDRFFGDRWTDCNKKLYSTLRDITLSLNLISHCLRLLYNTASSRDTHS